MAEEKEKPLTREDAVSFTALGYGNWAPLPTGWVKWLGAFEAFIGVFMMALILVTFVRKWTR